MANEWSDRVAVITGGAAGLGLATARRLAAHGVKLALFDARPEVLEKAMAEFGSAAIGELCRLAFDGDRLHKLWLMVFATNQRAQRTYARAGFRTEGVLREEYFHDGGWHDMVRMSLLDHEWRAGGQPATARRRAPDRTP